MRSTGLSGVFFLLRIFVGVRPDGRLVLILEVDVEII